MEKFVHDENLKLFRKQLAEITDEKQRQVLCDLIEEEEEKYRRWQLEAGPE
jgi:rubrerythrin